MKLHGLEEITDFVEWQCIKQQEISILQTVKPFVYSSDEIQSAGIDDASDEVINLMDDILAEMNRRRKASRENYPFEVLNRGYQIKISTYNKIFWVYSYLLLSTRLNMSENKEWRNIDGTKIFEELSSVIAQNYFGVGSESIVFGTALDGSFGTKVKELCLKLGEGHSFINRDGLPPTAQDDKLDVVVWKTFNDKSRSKLIGFGQCKTGTTWDDASTIELQPTQFCEKWFRDVPITNPVKMFFSAQYFPLDMFSKMRNAGLVFDRFRIMDYLPEELNNSLLDKITLWCRVAIFNN